MKVQSTLRISRALLAAFVTLCVCSLCRANESAELTKSIPPSLERAVALARERAPEVVVSRAQLETSRAAVVGASLPSLANPYLEVLASRGNNNVTRDVELMTQLIVPVEVAGQRSRRIAEANAWVSVHSFDLERVRAVAAGAAARAWGMALCESARLQSLLELTQSAQSEFEMLAARRTVGDATEQDVQLAAIELSRHRTLLDEARANLARALGLLEVITGVQWPELPVDSLSAPTNPITRGTHDTAQIPLVRSYRAEADLHQRSLDRYSRESWSPLNFIVTGGRGDFGEARVGLGVGMNLPVVRRLQGEKAKASGDRNRALTQAEVAARTMRVRLKTIGTELQSLRAALSELETNTAAAARAAVLAATELRRLGKSDYLAVLVARRELTNVAQRRIELHERQWGLYAEWVELTGKLR